MQRLFDYLNNESIGSSFQARLSERGGYITFSNSGRRGDTKYFQIGIDTILQTLRDILENIHVFSSLQEYEERPWRDNGAEYFKDPVANATSTVQTKPLFSTLSKVIKWANQPRLNEVDTDHRIILNHDVLNQAINSLEDVAETFKPTVRQQRRNNINLPLQQIFYGAPGTGKSFTIDDTIEDGNSVRTTFHPDSDYASFVGAYKPTMAPVPINAFVGTTVHHAKNAKAEDAYEQKIVYKYVPQAFLKAYVAAWSNLDKPFYLIIEEINRGNCAQIFGDLFQLLDRNNIGCSSYAIHADEDISQFLKGDSKGFAMLLDEQKAAISTFKLIKDNGKTQDVGQDILDGKLLLLPPNLHIWATMNTSDQSLFPIDSAFKRRWNWKYMPIEYHPIDKYTNQPIDWKFRIGDNLYSWGEFLGKINPRILDITRSEDKQMGYFFAKPDIKSKEKLTDNDTISENIFVNKILFYLWTDVLRDYDLTEDPFVYEKENGKVRTAYRFTDFFKTDGMDLLAQFVNGLKLKEISMAVDAIAEESSDTTPDGVVNDSLSVRFPDGETINKGKLCNIYIQSLKKIGLERASEVFDRKGYKLPLIAKDKVETSDSASR